MAQPPDNALTHLKISEMRTVLRAKDCKQSVDKVPKNGTLFAARSSCGPTDGRLFDSVKNAW